MTRITKNIPVFFLFLATFVFYAHLIIPHDHHMADSDASRKQPCPASNKEAKRHPSFPVHCHAFNDLTSEKAIIYVNIKYNQSNDFMPGCIIDAADSDLHLAWITISNIFQLPVSSAILELSSLRAPPTNI